MEPKTLKAKIGDDYVSKLWPDETSALEIASKTMDKYLEKISRRLTEKNPFRIGGIGCGPLGNAQLLRLLVDKILEKNKDLQIEILLVDLSCNEAQLKHCYDIFPEKNVLIFSGINSYYERSFSDLSMDIILSLSCLCYPAPEWSPKSNYESIFYIHGTNYDESIEEDSAEMWLKIVKIMSEKLRKDGLLIVIEYGTTDIRFEEIKIVDSFFTMMGNYLHKSINKYSLKKFGIPLIQRNNVAMSVPFINQEVNMEIFELGQLMDNDAHFKYLYKVAKTDEERTKIQLQMINAATKPFIMDESNLENVVAGWEEFLEIYTPECIKEKYLTGIPGVFFSAIKL